jgi:hypothetical protein
MKATNLSVAALAVACMGIWSAQVFAQANGWTGGVGGNWTDSTWQFGAPPSIPFDASGIVGSTAGSSSPTGEVNVNSDIRVSNSSPTVVLGNGAGTSGTLNINSSGAFSVEVDPGGGAGSTGVLVVGLNGGIGILNVSGILEVENRLELATSGNAASTITLSGSASVTADNGFLDRNLIIDGSSVSASFTNDLILGQSGTHTWRIPAGGASTLSVGGDVDLGGALNLEFPDGAPTVGSTWNLIDSATVDDGEANPSSFNNIDQSAVLGLVPGSTFAVQSAPDGGSTNGVYTKLLLEQHPVLVVDRSTGTTSIQNFHGSAATVAFDTYTIGSALGSLNPAGWTSISPANDWVEAQPTSTALSELIPNPGGSDSIAASTSVSLGAAVVLPAPTAFGQENEDITFRFAKPTDSTFTQGRVIYTGVPNNTLTLNVDPDTGEAQILNGTGFTVSIDTYVISSPNGLLKFADGDPADTWDSLQDQGTSGGLWFESNVSSTQISELLVVDGMELAPNATVDLGSPFNDALGAVEGDLVFQFALVGGSSAGDYNENGIIDAADYTAWRDALTAGSSTLPNDPTPGTVDESDFMYWRDHFGQSTLAGPPALMTGKVLYSPLVTLGAGSGAGAAAVPEPGTGTLALVCLAVSAFVTSGRRRS